MSRRDDSPLIIPIPKPTPRFGVRPSRKEEDKRREKRQPKHRFRESVEL